MARPRKYVIKLTDDELKTLKSIIRKSNTSKTIRSRCQIIIDLDEAHGKVLTHEQSARSNGVCLTTVTNTVTKYFSGGIEAVTEFKRNINSDNARRILDGCAEARIIELACGPVPRCRHLFLPLVPVPAHAGKAGPGEGEIRPSGMTNTRLSQSSF